MAKMAFSNKQYPIQHAYNMGEVKVGQFKVDGQCTCCRTNVFEFYGCYWHGCPTCFPNRQQRINNGKETMKEVYQRTCDRKRSLEQQGLHVTELWECELNRQLKESLDMKQFFDNCQIEPPINPREPFLAVVPTQRSYITKRNRTKRYIILTSVVCTLGFVNMDAFL